MKNGDDIVLNTKRHGVMYFNTSKFISESETLSLEDLMTIPDQNNGRHSAACLFADE